MKVGISLSTSAEGNISTPEKMRPWKERNSVKNCNSAFPLVRFLMFSKEISSSLYVVSIVPANGNAVTGQQRNTKAHTGPNAVMGS